MNESTRITPDAAGCWVDGDWGWRGRLRVIEIARDRGFPLTVDEILEVEAYYDDSGYASLCGELDVIEAVTGQGGIADRAEEWLNEYVAPAGFSFRWHDGEFFLAADGEW